MNRRLAYRADPAAVLLADARVVEPSRSLADVLKRVVGRELPPNLGITVDHRSYEAEFLDAATEFGHRRVGILQARHSRGCVKCGRGEGHRVFVMTVSYSGGRAPQFSVRRERVAEVRQWLRNYQELKEMIEADL